jgi:hypothetical protein
MALANLSEKVGAGDTAFSNLARRSAVRQRMNWFKLIKDGDM